MTASARGERTINIKMMINTIFSNVLNYAVNPSLKLPGGDLPKRLVREALG